jgi:hypothetical protein
MRQPAQPGVQRSLSMSDDNKHKRLFKATNVASAFVRPV